MENVFKVKQWTFSKFGLVSLEMVDSSGMFEINARAPCCLYQAMLPSLVFGGVVDNLSISEPLTVWTPKISSDLFSRKLIETAKFAPDLIESEIQKSMTDLMKLFGDISKLVNDPNILTFMLPLGTYVNFRLRTNPPGALSIIKNIQNVNVDGIYDFQWCMASALAEVIQYQNGEEKLLR